MNINSSLLKVKKSGLRITPIRTQITQILTESMYPVSAADILSSIKANKTTIYREIAVLLDNGFLIEFDFGDRVKRYELADRPHHHHLICVKCKSVKDVDVADDFVKSEKKVLQNNKFKILRHTLEFFGLCENCRS